MARDDTRSPWAMSRTRSLVKSQARSLLSMAKLKSAKSRVFSASWSLTRIAQISLTRSGGFLSDKLSLVPRLMAICSNDLHGLSSTLREDKGGSVTVRSGR